MELEEVLKFLLYCMKHYKDHEFENAFSLYDYYSIMDISPNDFALVARRLKKFSASAGVLEFSKRHFLGQCKFEKDKILKCGFNINNKEFTDEDKLTVMEKMEAEGYPLVNSVYCTAARNYAFYGVDGISKEKTKNEIIAYYSEATGIKCNVEDTVIQQARVLAKKI